MRVPFALSPARSHFLTFHGLLSYLPLSKYRQRTCFHSPEEISLPFHSWIQVSNILRVSSV